jgi:hypothetical protein
MDRPPWNWLISPRQTGVRRTTRRESRTKLGPACEGLDCRRLLSAATVAVFSPPTTAVASAVPILEGAQPTAFAQFQTDIARAEQHSHVNAAQASALGQDVSTIDQAIDAAGLTTSATSAAINDVQDWADNAFTAGPAGIRDVAGRIVPTSQTSKKLEKILVDVPSVFTGTASDASVRGIHQGNAQATPLNQLIGQMKVVARAARVTPALQTALNHNFQEIAGALGPDPYTDLGPGATHRDPLVVYYDAQVVNFVKS